MTDRTIGFIGLGVMGTPMARNLMGAGYSLVVHNRTPAKAQALAQLGARVAGSPQEVAQLSEVAITMVPDSPDVEHVYLADEGLLAGATPGQLFIDMSSIEAQVARSLAQRAGELGVQMLDAPVSGADVGAQEGTLSIMVGGESEAFERALPILRCLGRTIVHVGSAGAGQIVKACNQVLIAGTIEAVSEALVLGSKAGVDPKALLQALSGGLAASRVLELKSEKMLSHRFTPGFRASLHHKDLRNALAAAGQLGVPLLGAQAADELLEELIAEGLGNEDHSAMLRRIEARAGHRVGEQPPGER
ncbi:MAG: NAD(P)-dependent oxidoreductase [Solirubrobacteraceae bacterium]